MKTFTAFFRTPEAAIHAGERAREAAGQRATVRVFVPGANRSVVEMSILDDERPVWKVPIFGLLVGTAFAALLAAGHYGLGWVLLGFWTGLATGGMLGFWLTGEIYPRRVVPLRTDGDANPYARVIAQGRGVVTVVLPSTRRMKAVFAALERSSADIIEGFLHEAPSERLEPQST